MCQSEGLYIKTFPKVRFSNFWDWQKSSKAELEVRYFKIYRPSGEIYVRENGADMAAEYVASLQSERRRGRRKVVVWRATIVVLGIVLGVFISMLTRVLGLKA
ncbi:hypothetical protein B5T_03174 [Alloalcanivorax dieselolei B5]|uniref:Uncharacterized protein n=1 Tax=Alcanivorax dieselolei (strain DSM 16502 / CGMCC 1.3690 / MCCC 1A00001 / B-5) TaxID=930169 RepID=K0CIP2_ALCDB|nr:hypothetical protein B5T_03174 [Alloalcanivorax dieselolei B5]GGK11039.1 hypothetical protein GCM10007426_43900 [Alloalcanivorax dieselolei]